MRWARIGTAVESAANWQFRLAALECARALERQLRTANHVERRLAGIYRLGVRSKWSAFVFLTAEREFFKRRRRCERRAGDTLLFSKLSIH